MKKTLLSIVICVLCTTFITTTILVAHLFNLQIDTMLLITDANPLSENSAPAIETLKDIENELETKITEYKETDDTLPAGYPFMVFQLIVNHFLPFIMSITDAYITALVVGISLGIFIDLIFIKKYQGKKLLLNTLLSLISIIVVLSIPSVILGFTLLSNSTLPLNIVNLADASSLLIKNPVDLIIGCLLVFDLIYIVNCVCNLIEIRKINKALNTKTPIKRVVRKILIALLIPTLFIIVVNILSSVDFAYDLLCFLYNSDIIWEISSFFQNLFYEIIYFFPI